MAKEVLVTADKINKRKKIIRMTKIISLILFIILSLVFIILSLIYKGGKFMITLDPNAELESSLVLFEDEEDKEVKRRLYADEIPFMDNISIKWLPENIDTEKDGSHNGDNYIAYTFYVEHRGKSTVNYWYEVIIDDVIKRVDDAIRIMIFLDGEPTVYAKINSETGEAEPDTTPFYSSKVAKGENIAVLEQRKNFTPGDIDKFTIVVWLEGDDPDCVNAIIGGEIKMHMNIREEHLNPDELKKQEEELKKQEEEKENSEVKEEENKEENGEQQVENNEGNDEQGNEE